MSVKEESITGVMIDGCFPNPQNILEMLAASEQQEVCLYNQIAQSVPCEELRRIIRRKAASERRMEEKLALLSQCFGTMPAMPPTGAMPFAAGEEKEK